MVDMQEVSMIGKHSIGKTCYKFWLTVAFLILRAWLHASPTQHPMTNGKDSATKGG